MYINALSIEFIYKIFGYSCVFLIFDSCLCLVGESGSLLKLGFCVESLLDRRWLEVCVEFVFF